MDFSSLLNSPSKKQTVQVAITNLQVSVPTPGFSPNIIKGKMTDAGLDFGDANFYEHNLPNWIKIWYQEMSDRYKTIEEKRSLVASFLKKFRREFSNKSIIELRELTRNGSRGKLSDALNYELISRNVFGDLDPGVLQASDQKLYQKKLTEFKVTAEILLTSAQRAIDAFRDIQSTGYWKMLDPELGLIITPESKMRSDEKSLHTFKTLRNRHTGKLAKLANQKLEEISEEQDKTNLVKSSRLGADAASVHSISNSSALKQDELKSQLQTLLETSEDLYYNYWSGKLQEMYSSFHISKKIVETPFVLQIMDQIVKAVSSGKMVMMIGDLGMGKSEIARQTVIKYLSQAHIIRWLSEHPRPAKPHQPKQNTDKETWNKYQINLKAYQIWEQDYRSHLEPITLDGKEGTTTEEVFGGRSLKASSHKGAEQKFAEMQDKIQSWKIKYSNRHGNLPSAEELRTYTTQLETEYQAFIETSFELGPLYRAMQEGRPLIIDEITAIPARGINGVKWTTNKKTWRSDHSKYPWCSIICA